MYAEDNVLVVEREEDLQDLPNALHYSCSVIVIVVSGNKSKLIISLSVYCSAGFNLGCSISNGHIFRLCRDHSSCRSAVRRWRCIVSPYIDKVLLIQYFLVIHLLWVQTGFLKTDYRLTRSKEA